MTLAHFLTKNRHTSYSGSLENDLHICDGPRDFESNGLNKFSQFYLHSDKYFLKHTGANLVYDTPLAKMKPIDTV